MGDRAYVTLSVLTEQVEEAKKLIDDGWCDEGTWANGLCTYFGYEEVNNGDLDFLGKLEEAGIAYESQWEAGSEFGEGTEYLRFTAEGVPEVKSIYENQKSIQLSTLLLAIDDHAELIKLIRQCEQEVSTLPWANQVEYGKIYRATQLIVA